MTDKFMPEGFNISSRENLEAIGSISSLEKAIESGEILESRVIMCDNDHNLVVELGEYNCIIPRSEALMTLPFEESREIAVITRVGKPVCRN